jgi:hypothetical protein
MGTIIIIQHVNKTNRFFLCAEGDSKSGRGKEEKRGHGLTRVNVSLAYFEVSSSVRLHHSSNVSHKHIEQMGLVCASTEHKRSWNFLFYFNGWDMSPSFLLHREKRNKQTLRNESLWRIENIKEKEDIFLST